MVDGLSLSLSNQVLDSISSGIVTKRLSLEENAFIECRKATVSAILLEQFVACPLVYSSWDIQFPMIMNGAPVESVPGQVKGKIGPLLLENAEVWSFLNVVIYNLPVQYRLPTMSVADIFWQLVIASVAAEAGAAEASGDQGLNIDETTVTCTVQNKGQCSRKGPTRLTG
jgi:hypothetical protein